jgi:integrase
MKLTAKEVRGLQLPAGKIDHIVWDDEIPGLGVRMRVGGSRKWVFQYALGVKQWRMTLGAATDESFKTAKDIDGNIVKLGIREQAAQLHAKVKLGQNPAGEKEEGRRRAGETFEVIAKRYLAEKKETMRPSSYIEKERHILVYAKPLHHRSVNDITQRHIAETLRALREDVQQGQQGKRGSTGAITANRARSSLSDFFKWAMGEGIAAQNPVVATNKFEEKARARVLADDELRWIWDCLGNDDYGAIVKLLMLTACRLDEIASLRWSEISDGAITLPNERTKNGYEHWVPVSDPALQIIEARPRRVDDNGLLRTLVFGIGQGGFAGEGRGKLRLDKAIAVKHGRPLPKWTHHDLRRTCATVMAERLNILPHVIEAVLNHQSGHKAGVAGVYNRAEYRQQKRDALVKWADYLMAIAEERDSNIVPLRQPA